MANRLLIITCFSILIILCLRELTKIAALNDELVSLEYSESHLVSSKLSFTSLKGEKVLVSDIQKHLQLVLVYFDPTCEPCISMTEKMIQYHSEFSDYDVLFISESNVSELLEFANRYDFTEHMNMWVLMDSNEIMYRKFGLFQTPSFVILDDKLEIVSILDEYVTFPILMKYVRGS